MQGQSTHWEQRTKFDVDSFQIGIDNRCSACTSHEPSDFEGGLIDTNRTIKGFGGTRTTNVQRGTLRWRLLDNDGKTHKFLIPNPFCVPSGKVPLFSLKDWAKEWKDTKPTEGTGSTTTSKSVMLCWNQHKINWKCH